ncbi:GNAT family N-acetyltransferase [Lactobacillaceae bacterium 24-114]
MKYTIKKDRITLTDDGDILVGEISFPAIEGFPNRVVLERVFVNPDYRGQHLAADLVKRFVDYATDHQLVVKLMCPYAIKQFKLHSEYQELLLPEDRF